MTGAAHQSIPIARLSVEIFASIFDVADSPQDVVNLACTSKQLAHLTEAALRRHRDAFQRFRHASDRDPHTIVALVRQLVLRHDPVVGNYFRSFDVWGARLSWDEWQGFSVDVDEHCVKLDGVEAQIDRFTQSEIDRLLAVARDIVGEGELPAAREELKNGGDGLLKMLIITSAPRLESLKFIRREDIVQKTCQAWLFKAINHQLMKGSGRMLSESHWPAGLRSLQHLAVGVDAGLSEEEVPRPLVEPLTDWEGEPEVSAMMRLPSLTSLYYHTGCFPYSDGDEDLEDEEAGDSDPEIDEENPSDVSPSRTPRMSSGVTHLYLDAVRGRVDYEVDLPAIYSKLLAMPCALESFACRWRDEGEWNPSKFLYALHNYQQESLHTMMFYNPSPMSGYRCSAYRPEDVPSARLRMWWQCAEDVELQALYDRSEGQATRADLVETFVKYLDTDYAEVIILDGDAGATYTDTKDPVEGWSYYQDALCALVSSAGQQTLKALFIDFPHREDSYEGVHSPDGFAKLVKLAGEMGVDLYGSKHLKSKRKHVLSFPMAPSKWDIVSGPYYGKRVEQGFTEYDCVGDKWSTPERDQYSWHYVEPKRDS